MEMDLCLYCRSSEMRVRHSCGLAAHGRTTLATSPPDAPALCHAPQLPVKGDNPGSPPYSFLTCAGLQVEECDFNMAPVRFAFPLPVPLSFVFSSPHMFALRRRFICSSFHSILSHSSTAHFSNCKFHHQTSPDITYRPPHRRGITLLRR